MITFGPNRENKDGTFDAPYARTHNSRFLMEDIPNIQTTIPQKLLSMLEPSSKQKHVNGLVKEMNDHIRIIEGRGDRSQAKHLIERIQELLQQPLNKETIRSLEELHQHVIRTANSIDE